MRISKIVLPLDYDSPFWKNNFGFLKKWIMTDLGSPIIRVELTEEMLCQSIHEAIHIYTKWDERTGDLDVIYGDLDGNNEYLLPPDMNSSLIKDVLFEII